MGGRSKKPTYADYEGSLRSLMKDSLPKITFIYGPSEFLRETARRALEGVFVKNNIPSVSVEGDTLQPLAFQELWEQGTLFDPVSGYVIKRSDKNKGFSKLLDSIPDQSAISSQIIIIGHDKLLVGMSKSLSRLGAAIVPCFEPWPNEMSPLIKKLATKRKVKLNASAVDALIESIGTDLSKLANELDKISLIDLEEKELSGADVRPYLGLIREDHVFKLDQYLADGNWGLAHALASDLLSRGEKALQILWVFTNHCRKALQAHKLRSKGMSSRDIGFKLRLPPGVAKSYNALINRTAPDRFHQVLAQCQLADMALKTSRTSEELVLSQLVEGLAGRPS